VRRVPSLRWQMRRYRLLGRQGGVSVKARHRWLMGMRTLQVLQHRMDELHGRARHKRLSLGLRWIERILTTFSSCTSNVVRRPRCPLSAHDVPTISVFEEHLVSSHSDLGCLPEKVLVWTLRFLSSQRRGCTLVIFFRCKLLCFLGHDGTTVNVRLPHGTARM
jgi:hypothetical protein